METAPVVDISLNQRAVQTYEARKRYTEARQLRVDAEIAFRQEHSDLYGDETEAQYAKEAAEDALRDAALAAYDGENKAVGAGVNIAELTRPNYERSEALAWAIEHGVCLLLDEKGFNDTCKSDSTRPGFVTMETVLQARIAQDLGKALGLEE